jgi:putative ABC transport system substrate-binding protein
VALAMVSIAGAQQPAHMPVIGWLASTSPEGRAAQLEAFREALGQHGFVEGKNVAIEYRWAGGDYAKLPALAADLVRSSVDVIFANGGRVAADAAKEASSTIPIVFTAGGIDPVAAGFIASFARPGGNLTGAYTQNTVLGPKRLELLHEAVPNAALVAVLDNPPQTFYAERLGAVKDAAHSLGVELVVIEARSEGEFEGAFEKMAQARAGAMLQMPDAFFYTRHREIVALAARHKLPAIYDWPEIAEDGGLMAYGDNLIAMYRRAGDYAGRILKGAKPADLPVEQPGIPQLVINLQTAKELGLTFPPSILARADEVIE